MASLLITVVHFVLVRDQLMYKKAFLLLISLPPIVSSNLALWASKAVY